MTVKELINRLQQIPNQEMKVVVNGYEGGFDDIKESKPIIVYEKIDHKWWDGKYEQSSSGQGGSVMLLLSRT
jgi:hypothetical protein